jgi:hypothetical protein
MNFLDGLPVMTWPQTIRTPSGLASRSVPFIRLVPPRATRSGLKESQQARLHLGVLPRETLDPLYRLE